MRSFLPAALCGLLFCSPTSGIAETVSELTQNVFRQASDGSALRMQEALSFANSLIMALEQGNFSDSPKEMAAAYLALAGIQENLLAGDCGGAWDEVAKRIEAALEELSRTYAEEHYRTPSLKSFVESWVENNGFSPSSEKIELNCG